MKLVIAIINKEDAAAVTGRLNEQGFGCTRLSTTGGFLRAGNTTLLIGTEKARVQEVVSILGSCCSRRTQIVDTVDPAFAGQFITARPMEVSIGGATVFVIDVEQFFKM
ncbi:MAG: cyclic-di-AMP receptor [Clostridia bacterium]|nr:cyclic-di-AMP receptor [Clostridia bacterium]MBR0510831.1 cyclic-di-AMP receptor [Clostridia bacterium]MBR0536971.1 cyclic-di-AMP receptor [Clostridia bacterium]